jgi:Flp pilus assembly protein TadD
VAAPSLTDSGAALRQAMALHRAGRVREADEQYGIVLRAEPSHPQALRLRGILARDAGDFDHSLRLLRKAVEATDSDPEPAAELGLSYLAAGYLQLAEAAFRTALARDADSPKALANLGALLQYRGHIQASIDCYRRVLALDPDDLEVRCNLANTLVEAGRGDEALAECDTALAMAPDRPELLATRGAVLCGLERYADAIPVLEAALATGPDDMALINLGLAHQQLGQTSDATAALDTAVRVNPDNARAVADLTTLLSAERRASEALALSADFLARHPGERLVLAARAVVLRDVGRAVEARELVDLERLVHIRELPAARLRKPRCIQRKLAATVLADTSHSRARRARRPGVDPRPASSTPISSRSAPFATRSTQKCVQCRELARGRLREPPGHGPGPRTSGPCGSGEQCFGPGGHQLPHLHPLAWLSGVYYVAVPPGLGDAGALEFGEPPSRVTARIEPERRRVSATPGRLVLFPSWFWHRTLPFAQPGERISVAFDVMP